MTDWRAKWQAVVADLEQQRDELQLKLHLAKAEARDEWARLNLDEKIATLRQRADAAGGEAKGAMKDIGAAADRLADEIREGLDRIRKTL